jgi:hypothetical protein
MKTATNIKLLAVFISIIALFYCAIAFMYLDFDPRHWPLAARYAFGVFYLFVICLYWVIRLVKSMK